MGSLWSGFCLQGNIMGRIKEGEKKKEKKEDVFIRGVVPLSVYHKTKSKRKDCVFRCCPMNQHKKKKSASRW